MSKEILPFFARFPSKHLRTIKPDPIAIMLLDMLEFKLLEQN